MYILNLSITIYHGLMLGYYPDPELDLESVKLFGNRDLDPCVPGPSFGAGSFIFEEKTAKKTKNYASLTGTYFRCKSKFLTLF